MLSPQLRSRFIKSANMMLAAAAGGLVLMLGQSLMEHSGLYEGMSDLDQDVVHNDVSRQGSEPSSRLKTTTPDLAQFQIVLDRDPFHSPYETLVTVPVKAVPPPPPVSPQPTVAIPKPPLPPLSVTLLGTVVIGDDRKAILRDGKQEDIYSVGQAVGGGVLVSVDDDRVVIARGDEQTPLLLKSAMESAAAQAVVLPVSGVLLPEKLAAENKKYKVDTGVKPVVATPAMARYPKFVRQPQGEQER